MKRKSGAHQFIPPLLALLALAALLYPLLGNRIVSLSTVAGGVLYTMPFVLAAVFGFLALRLNQLTLFFIGVHLILAYLFLGRAVETPFLEADLALYARLFSLLTPLSLILFYLLPGGRLFDTRGSLRMGLTVGLPLLLLLLYQLRPVWFETLSSLRVAPWPLPLPQLGLLLIPILAALLGLTKQLGFFEISLLWALPPLYVLYYRLISGDAASARLELSVVYTLIFFILLYALYRLYWYRVYMDELTRLYNRRAFDERLRLLGRKDTLAMIDIDHFKQINDTHGHQVGDNILRWVAKHLSQRFGRHAFRYGGEEFAVIFPHIEAEDARRRLDAARQALADSAFFLRSKQRETNRKSKRKRGSRTRKNRIQVTFSGGIASGNSVNPGKNLKQEDILRRADQALYKAKEAGRNRVFVL